MELDSKSIREVTFGAKVRGYDPAEVDEFIVVVAAGYDELQERLRRAVDRATKAEAQLASAGGGGESATINATPAGVAAGTQVQSTEISKVWERAVAAAEAAITEAKETAQQLLESAQRDAEAQVSGAQSEAARIAEDAQQHLRSDVSQLEEARDRLRNDAERLTETIEQERERVRSVLARALSVIEEYSQDDSDFSEFRRTLGLSAPPAVDADLVSESGSETNGYNNDEDQDRQEATSGSLVDTNVEEEVYVDAQNDNPAIQPSETPASSIDWKQPQWQMNKVDEPQDPDAQSEAEGPGDDEAVEPAGAAPDADQDPFLAELRKAVQDDGPLGPRDEAPIDENPIDSLYATDDEDDTKKGFFPWKKQ